MTGVEFNREFDRVTDKSYADYYGPQTKNQFFKRALLYTIENTYKGLDAQIPYDEISSLISTNTEFIPRGNLLYIKPLQIRAIAIIGTTATVTTALPHFALNGETLSITSSGFTPLIDGQYVITVVNPTTFNITVPPTTGALQFGSVVSPNSVSDYQHYLQSKCTYEIPLKANISSITDNQPIKVTLNKLSNARQGDEVTVILNQSTNNANGTFFIKREAKNTFSLYFDKDFTQPAIGNIPYVADSSDRIVIKRTNTTIPIVSDIRGQSIDPPTMEFPRYEIANNAIKYYPSGLKKVSLDYIKVSPVEIDFADNIIDLEVFFTERFLLRVVDYGALLFSQEIKDIQMSQMSTQRIIQN